MARWIERAVLGLAVALAIAGIVVGAKTNQTAIAGGLIALAPVLVIAFQSVQTRRAVDAAHADVVASRQLAVEAQRDRELAVQPFITGRNARSDERGQWVSLDNIGHGPAIQLRVLYRVQGAVHWNSGSLLLGAGESRPSSALQELLLLDRQLGASAVSDSIVSEPAPLMAYCRDQLGNWLRFNLRTGDAPEMWHANDPSPEWAGFSEYC